jgi:hypothetical protein
MMALDAAGPLRRWDTFMIVELFLREGDGGS